MPPTRAHRAAGLLRRALRRGYVEQLLRVQHAAQRRLLDRPAHVRGAGQVEHDAATAQTHRLCQRRLSLDHGVVVGGGPQREREVTAAAERAETRQPGDDLLVLKDAYRVFVHIEVDSNSESVPH